MRDARIGGKVRRAVSDLPLRWKILIPFAVLSLAYGASATYVFSRATAAEALADVTARLRDASTVSADSFEKHHSGLVGTVRIVARTQGMADAVARRDVVRLRRLAVPPALNSGHPLVLVVDRRGRPLIEVERTAAGPRVRTPGPGAVPAAVAGGTATQEVRGALIRRSGRTYLAALDPIRADPDGAIVGTAVSADRLDAVLRELTTLTRAHIGLADPRGRLLAGDPDVPRAAHAGGVEQFDGALGGRSARFLRAPVSVDGRLIGSLTVGLSYGGGLAALGDEAWKIAFLAVGVLGGVYLVGFGVARRVSNPLRQILLSTRALRQGHLEHRVALERGDELGELASSFNAMAEELQTSQGELERRVEERTHELSQTLRRLDDTNSELARAGQAKTAFLANMSHELRTPLSGILLAAEMLNDPRYDSLSAERRRRLTQSLQTNGRYLLALIQDLLDLSRIEAGRLDLHRAAIELGVLLGDVHGTVAPIAHDKGISVEIPLDAGGWVDVDPVRARQVLINLLTNAVKFSERGGRVWVTVRALHDAVAISVHDTGIGIQAKDMARIFEPFEQVTSRSQGTGLGLAIAKLLVELHGGELRVRSKRGEGSTFTVTFPRVAAPDRTSEREAAPSARRVRRARVLVVEDDPSLLELTSEVLQGAGYRVSHAAQVDEALRRVRTSRPDLVVLDLRLGDADGLQVVRGMRSEARTSRIPVLAVSAQARPEDIDRAMTAGCTDYVTKPVDTKVLLDHVDRAVEAEDGNGRRRGSGRAGEKRR